MEEPQTDHSDLHPYRSALKAACLDVEAKAPETAPDSWLWMDAPHADFRYPEFPLVPVGIEDLDLYARSLIDPRQPERVRLCGSLEELLRESLNTLSLSKLWCSAPALPELRALSKKIQLREIPGDPEEWETHLSKDSPSAIVLSNPNRVDGFFYPQGIYERLYHFLRARFPVTPIFAEESYNLFSFNSVAPGTLKKFEDLDPHLYFVGSVFPAISPQGPALSWISGKGAPLQGPRSALDPQLLRSALPALLAWASRQGRAVQEFHRRMLALKIGLRDFTERIGPALRSGSLRVPHWPEAGFYLLLDFSPWVAAQGKGGSFDLAVDLGVKTHLGLLPGHSFGRPQCMALCYAARPKAMRDAATRILRYLTEIKPAT